MLLRGLDKYPSQIPQSLRQSSTDMILELDEDDSEWRVWVLYIDNFGKIVIRLAKIGIGKSMKNGGKLGFNQPKLRYNDGKIN
jgi:hypothetical protein